MYFQICSQFESSKCDTVPGTTEAFQGKYVYPYSLEAGSKELLAPRVGVK